MRKFNESSSKLKKKYFCNAHHTKKTHKTFKSWSRRCGAEVATTHVQEDGVSVLCGGAVEGCQKRILAQLFLEYRIALYFECWGDKKMGIGESCELKMSMAKLQYVVVPEFAHQYLRPQPSEQWHERWRWNGGPEWYAEKNTHINLGSVRLINELLGVGVRTSLRSQSVLGTGDVRETFSLKKYHNRQTIKPRYSKVTFRLKNFVGVKC